MNAEGKDCVRGIVLCLATMLLVFCIVTTLESFEALIDMRYRILHKDCTNFCCNCYYLLSVWRGVCWGYRKSEFMRKSSTSLLPKRLLAIKPTSQALLAICFPIPYVNPNAH